MSKKSYDEIFSLFEEISNSYKRPNQYFDILYDSTSSIIISKSRTTEDISVNTRKSGIVARTYLGTWREIAFEDLSSLEKVREKVPTTSEKGTNIAEFEGWELNQEITPKINPSEIPIDEKIEKIRYIYDYCMKSDERIINVQIRYLEKIMERIFFNNEGCQLRQVIPRIRLLIIPIAKEGPKVDYDYFITGGEMGYEILDIINNEKLDTIVQNSLDMLNAKLAPSGRFPIILDPSMAGLIAHESFGHGLEADQILRGRSYLKEHLNQKVASEICTICDSSVIDNELGSYFFDDEGIRAGKNILVKDGILKDYIYDRRTASALNATPKGNGRRESFAHPVHPRMTNTYFEPGDYDLEEMISEIDNGLILIRGDFGMEDPLGGGMQCTSKKGYLIEKGEKTQLLKSIALSGPVLELLQNIDAINSDPIKLDGGTCGKGDEDMVPVTSGGCYIRVKNALISPG